MGRIWRYWPLRWPLGVKLIFYQIFLVLIGFLDPKNPIQMVSYVILVILIFFRYYNYIFNFFRPFRPKTAPGTDGENRQWFRDPITFLKIIISKLSAIYWGFKMGFFSYGFYLHISFQIWEIVILPTMNNYPLLGEFIQESANFFLHFE